MEREEIETKQKRQVIDITDAVAANVRGNGTAHIFVAHTTAAITTADLDPGTDEDFLDFLKLLTPQREWRHPHDPAHAPDHLLASLIGAGVSVPFEDGELALGTWQRIILVELDGPRHRDVFIALSA